MEYHCTEYKSPAAIFFGIIFLPICLLASVPGDEHWDNQFGPVGVSDPAYSITTLGDKIYAGGVFTSAGNTKAGAVACFDGTNWTALNNGIAGDFNLTYVFSLASDGANVYAGGIFTNADGSGAKFLAGWDGANWSPLGGKITNNPSSIVEVVKCYGTNLYAGGLFLTAGGVPVNGVAKWNGTSWSALGTGISGGAQPVVGALEYDGTNLYAGGSFTLAGGTSVANIAQWNGVSWSALGAGLPGQVLALARMGGYLYAGGVFTNTSLAITNLAKWDGNAWSGVGASGANRAVRDLVTDGTNLYAGGDFTTAGGLATKCIVKWNGSTWSALGAGVQSFGVGASPTVFKMAIDTKGRLCIAGNFNQVGGMGTSHIAIWDGTNWMAAGGKTSKGMTHFIGDVQSLLFDGTNLYAGGLFTEAGSNVVDGIAQWDGTNWSSLGTVTTGLFPTTGSTQVKALARAGSVLYAGGNFTNINGATALNVAQWNGSAWSPMASGLNGSVFTLAMHKGVLYAGGIFTGNGAGTASLHGIAQWNGSDWADVPLIESWRVNNAFNALVSDGVNLYAGGNFYIGWGFSPTYPTGDNVNNIGYWDGSFWHSMGPQPSNTVASIVISNGLIYAAGTFTGIGNITAYRVAKWNGTAWSTVGTGINPGLSSGSVSAITLANGNLYAAGSFTNAGGTPVESIAKWNGTSWSALGTGLSNSVSGAQGNGHALASSGNDIFVGGLISSAGDKPAMFISRWNDQLNFYPPPHLQLTKPARVATNQFLFRVAGTSGESYIIQASTNLVSWTALRTNAVTLYDYTDTNAPGYPKRFYRAVLGP